MVVFFRPFTPTPSPSVFVRPNDTFRKKSHGTPTSRSPSCDPTCEEDPRQYSDRGTVGLSITVSVLTLDGVGRRSHSGTHSCLCLRMDQLRLVCALGGRGSPGPASSEPYFSTGNTVFGDRGGRSRRANDLVRNSVSTCGGVDLWDRGRGIPEVSRLQCLSGKQGSFRKHDSLEVVRTTPRMKEPSSTPVVL